MRELQGGSIVKWGMSRTDDDVPLPKKLGETEKTPQIIRGVFRGARQIEGAFGQGYVLDIDMKPDDIAIGFGLTDAQKPKQMEQITFSGAAMLVGKLRSCPIGTAVEIRYEGKTAVENKPGQVQHTFKVFALENSEYRR